MLELPLKINVIDICIKKELESLSFAGYFHKNTSIVNALDWSSMKNGKALS